MVNASLEWSDDTELVSLVFTVSPQKDIILPTNYAKGLHAWFLHQVRDNDPQLSQYLHDGQSEKPFTISRLFGEMASNEKQVFLFAGKTYLWYLTALSQTVVQWLRIWLTKLPNHIWLEKSKLKIQSVEIALPGTNYNRLLKTISKKKIALSFLSATSFRSKGNHYPLPAPDKLFHSYLRRWNHFATKQFDPDEFLPWVEENVIITRHQLESTRVAGGKRGLVTGFMGAVELDLVQSAGDRPEFIKLYKALVQLAPYCGTGHKTTFGLGQTRLGWQTQKASIESTTLETLLTQRVGEIFEILMTAQKRTGGERAKNICQTRATILARREFGEPLVDIANDLKMPYQTVKTYAKLARRTLKSKMN